MLSIAQELVISHPQAEVFVTMTHPSSAVRWMSSLFDFEQSVPGTPAVGVQVWCSVKILGRRLRVDGRWMTYEPPHRCVIVSTISPFSYQVVHTCTPVADGTLARMQVDLDDRFFRGMNTPVLIEAIERMILYDLNTLKLLMGLSPSLLKYIA